VGSGHRGLDVGTKALEDRSVQCAADTRTPPLKKTPNFCNSQDPCTVASVGWACIGLPATTPPFGPLIVV